MYYKICTDTTSSLGRETGALVTLHRLYQILLQTKKIVILHILSFIQILSTKSTEKSDIMILQTRCGDFTSHFAVVFVSALLEELWPA